MVPSLVRILVQRPGGAVRAEEKYRALEPLMRVIAQAYGKTSLVLGPPVCRCTQRMVDALVWLRGLSKPSTA